MNTRGLSRVKVPAAVAVDGPTFTRESGSPKAGMMSLLALTFTRESEQTPRSSEGFGGQLKTAEPALWPWTFTRESPPDPAGRTGTKRRDAMTATHK